MFEPLCLAEKVILEWESHYIAEWIGFQNGTPQKHM
jgi:hypothetical protein